MIELIEITKGEKPRGNVLKVGGTSESDFYVKSEGGSFDNVDVNNYISMFNKMVKRNNFEFSLGYKAFNRKLLGYSSEF